MLIVAYLLGVAFARALAAIPVAVTSNQPACPGELVAVQCTLGGGALTWNTSKGAFNIIRGRQDEGDAGPFHWTLLELDENTLQSTLTFTATTGFAIGCNNDTQSSSVLVQVEGPPSAPDWSLTYLDGIQRINETFSSVSVVWDSPDTHNNYISRYVVSVDPHISMPANGVIEAANPQFQARNITLVLMHEQSYSIRVRADNCNNTQLGINSSALTINVSYCGAPQFSGDVTTNFTTTTLGSNATYQCRDGLTPSHTHTTQCTSGGVWEPDPSALDCRERVICAKLPEKNTTLFQYEDIIEGAILNVSCLEGFFLPEGEMEFVCGSDGSWTPDPNNYECTLSSTSSSDEELDIWEIAALVVVVIVVVSICLTVVMLCFIFWWRKKTKLNRKFQLGENSYVETAVTPNHIGQFLEWQSVPHSRTELIGQYLEANVMGNGSCSAGSTGPPPIPPHSPVTPHVKEMTYAEVGPLVSSTPRPPSTQTESVEYAILRHDAVVKPLPSEHLHPADHSVGLDQVLIQLQEVVPHWRDLAEAVGMDTESLKRIKRHVNSDGEAMVEVVDGWLARLYPNTPTWREIADVVEQIGHHQLSQSIKQVYITGYLPIEVSNAIPSDPIVLNAPLSSLPPRSKANNRDAPQPPALDSSDGEEQPPPIPVKASHTMSVLVQTY